MYLLPFTCYTERAVSMGVDAGVSTNATSALCKGTKKK